MTDALKQAALMLAVILVSTFLGGSLLASMTRAEPQPAPPAPYFEVWEWCGERFPGQPNLQEACRWGAYEMLPAKTLEARDA